MSTYALYFQVEIRNSMRILHIYGINQVAHIYGKYLAGRGHAFTVFEPTLVGAPAPLPLKLCNMPWRMLDMRRIVGRLNSKHFDIVHIHWASYGLLGLVSRIPFIVHCHGDDVLRPTFRPILTPIFRRAAAVLCITPDLLPQVQAIRPDAIFFPGPVDTNRFTLVEDSQLDPSHRWTVLLFTRLDPKKGPEIATQGIARFARRHPNVRVLLLDWGMLREKYKRLYSGRFEFIPRVAPDEVHHLIWSADVVVGQFAAGALGLAELQAMSCGKPVIASFRYEEAYPTLPPLCQATTVEEIDEHLENLFIHPEIATALGQRAREWVIHYHDYRPLSDKLETVYRSILEC